MNKSADRLLTIALSCVGDAVMCTPVLESLHLHFPNAKIDIVADRRSSQLFEYCPYRGEIFFKEKDAFLRGAPRLIHHLRKTKYEIIVDLRTDGLAYLLRGKKKYTKWTGRPYGNHAVEQLMGIIRPIHAEDTIPAARVWIDQSSLKFADTALADIDKNRLLVIGAGCGGCKEKRWQADKYVDLVNNNTGYFTSVVLMGGVDDQQYSDAIRPRLPLSYVDLTGKTDLLQAAAVLQKAQVYIGADSGLGHIAAAVGTSTISLFSVDRPERCRPWGGKIKTIAGEHNDARNISVDNVQAFIDQLIHSK